MSKPPVISFRGVSKHFGATSALEGVSLEVYGGEVLVLAGENGAGKSTLMRILAGVIADYDGSVELDGRPVRFAGPAAARRAGVATIHQELSLIGAMSVADNIAIGDAGAPWGLVSRRRQHERARTVLAALGLEVSPAAIVERLPLATRQLIEIARALAQEARVVVMDEPTSALSDAETAILFEQLDTLRERGVAVVFISHRLDEMERVADRIAVLRDGRLVVTAAAADLPRAALVRQMIGSERAAAVTSRSARSADAPGAALDVRGLSVAGEAGLPLLDDVGLALRRGEIVGVTGLHGSGADVLPLAVFGAIPAGGTVAVAGDLLLRPSPRASIAAGMILLSGDRGLSLVRSLSVVANTTLSSLPKFSRWGWLDRAAELESANRARERLHIDCPSLAADVSQLSGGNQQKVAIARCVSTAPRVLLLHEPSRGIDVGAKAEVHAFIDELSATGVAVLLVSTDFEELMTLSDRMLVMNRGSVVLELDRARYDRALILSAAMGADAIAEGQA